MREVIALTIFVTALVFIYLLGRFVEKRKSKQQQFEKPNWDPPRCNSSETRAVLSPVYPPVVKPSERQTGWTTGQTLASANKSLSSPPASASRAPLETAGNDYHINTKTGRVYLAITEEYILKKYHPERLLRARQGETLKRYPVGEISPVEVPINDLQGYTNHSLVRQHNQFLSTGRSGHPSPRYGWLSGRSDSVSVGRVNGVHLNASKKYPPKRKK